jgi:hypothetical protein
MIDVYWQKQNEGMCDACTYPNFNIEGNRAVAVISILSVPRGVGYAIPTDGEVKHLNLCEFCLSRMKALLEVAKDGNKG